MKYTDLVNAITDIEESRSIPNEVIMEALAEGLEKAYRKHVKCPDATLRMVVGSDDNIRLYQQRTVVEDVVDDEIELALEDARDKDPDIKLGDTVEEEVSINEFGRSSVTLVKNVMLQKIKEASKQVIYDEYIDKVSDMVWGVVQTVEEKFVLVDLGKTLGIMLKSDQIPGERYADGQRIQVVIKSVSKESKGSQVTVSRSSANLVKRLFENSVPEIYDGTVTIKAIAREAGERTKMAVYSNNANVDPIGACIGPRGSRVVGVIEAITQRNNPYTHESIDIVEWNNNYVEYVKNVMKPAEVIAVIPDEQTGDLTVVVENDKLSLAIGKRGINAKLAVKLLGRKIDIKTQQMAEEEGIDWYNQMLKFQAQEIARLRMEEIRATQKPAEETDVTESEEIRPSETTEAPVVEETVEAEAVKPVEDPAETAAAEETEVRETTKRRKPKLTVKATEYVSKFEELADARKENVQTAVRKKKKSKQDEEDQQIREQLENLKNKEYEIRPEFTDEELEEFEYAEDEHWYDDDVDYDEYDEFYDDEK